MGIWKRKSIQELAASSEGGPHKLNRHLGPINLMMLGIGCIIGAGLFSITGIAASENAGPAIVVAFIIAAFGCAFSCMCYSELSSMIPVAGSAYTYAYATLGEFMAWMIGWDLILEHTVGGSTVAISWSAYVVSFLQDFGIYLPTSLIASPWQSTLLPNGEQAYGIINLPAVIIFMLVSFISIIGIKQSAQLNAFLVILKVMVVITFIALGSLYINPANYHPFLPENTGTVGEFGWSGLMRASGVVFFAFIGFDTVSTLAQETKNPQRNVPIGMIGSLVICTLLYVLFAFVMTGLVNYKQLDVAAPVALAIEQTPYHWLKPFVKAAIIAGLTSVLLATSLGQTRIFYSMACDGLLPPIFARIHPRFHTPWISNIVLMIFVGTWAALAPISLLGHMTSIGTLLAFVIVCASVLALRYTDPQLHRPFKTPWVPYTPILGILFCLAMMFFLGFMTWIRLLVWLAIGMSIYFFYGRKGRD